MVALIERANVDASASFDEGVVRKDGEGFWLNQEKTSPDSLTFVALACLAEAVAAELALTQGEREERAARAEKDALYANRLRAAREVEFGGVLDMEPCSIVMGGAWQGTGTSSWNKEVKVEGASERRMGALLTVTFDEGFVVTSARLMLASGVVFCTYTRPNI
ncbi:hypothetical protein DIE18_02535 [Burkholderia sp. Bp9125]|nr:hypothetical protein DIE18_02535 [Burkholderia sp. Bp9125]